MSGVAGVSLLAWLLFTEESPTSPPDKNTPVKTEHVSNVPALKPIGANSTNGSVGFLSIRTRPNATIMHQDTVLGTADEEGLAGPFEFETGRARIRASYAKSGFERTTTVYVKKGEDHSVNMVAREAKLTLTTNPGAKIELNGSSLSDFSDAIVVEEGSHHILIRHTKLRKGFESMVRLDHGEHKVIDIDLRRVGEDI